VVLLFLIPTECNESVEYMTDSRTGEGEDFSFTTIARAKNFDTHIAREIHGYETLDTLVRGMADAFIEHGTNVYDIGASTGRLLNVLSEEIDHDGSGRQANFIGFEPVSEFIQNFQPSSDRVTLLEEAVSGDTVFENASLVTSLFTLQFVPVHLRPVIIEQIHRGLHSNGAFIWAEKVVASDPKLESLINAQHIQLKRNGSDDSDILDKDIRLRSIMRPLSLAENINMLENAGFTRHEVFWRVNNFVAMVAIKSANITRQTGN
jgi:tRNA (cmo5U34)-methyltransferase